MEMELTKDAPTKAPNVAEYSLVLRLDSAETPDEVSMEFRVIRSLNDDPSLHGSDHGT
jgi:hypothetical protein